VRELAIQIGLIIGVVWLTATVLFLFAPVLNHLAWRRRNRRRIGWYS
jgi:hypothetical protein